MFNNLEKPYLVFRERGGRDIYANHTFFIGWMSLYNFCWRKDLIDPLISVLTDFIILCLLGQFIPYSLLLQELDIKNLRELEVNAHIHVNPAASCNLLYGH